MLRNVNELYGCSIAGSDGPLGTIRDCYFDDSSWTIRFFVVETDSWLGGRKVLLSPLCIQGRDMTSKALSASVTRRQVAASPDIDISKPVSRQHEVEQFGYYGYPFYWGDPQLWGGGPRPGISLGSYERKPLPTGAAAETKFAEAQVELHRERGDDQHLRSCRTIERYHLHARDGDIGHVESCLVDDAAWDIRYLVVNTSDWWLGHQTLLAPASIADISWLDATVAVDLTRAAIKSAPTYGADALPTLEQERALSDHYAGLVR